MGKKVRLTRSESQEVTRERLMHAARAIIVRDGLAAASVRAISEEAGYSQGAFYSNFESKEHLLVDVLAEQLKVVTHRLEQVAETVGVSGHGDRISTLEAVRHFFQNLNPKSDWSTLAVELWLHANRSVVMAERYAAMREAYLQRAGAAFRRMFENMGLTPSISPEDIAMGLTSASVGFAIQFGGPLTWEARARFMSAMFEGVVSTSSPSEG